MTAATSRLRRRGIGAGVAALVGLGSIAGLAGAAQAAPGFELERAGGADRFATAVQAAAQFEDTSSVVLVNGYTSIDALAASSLGLPILLTGQAQVPAATVAGLTQLGVKNITIVGGDSAVSDTQETALTAAGFTVDRIAGSDRYDTAEQVNNELTPADAKYAFVVNGTAPADALAASSAAAATGSPVVLVRPTEVGADAAATLAKFPAAVKVVVGGEDKVPASVYTTVGATARSAGADRFATAASFADWTIAQKIFDGTTAGLARGISTSALGVNDLADALVAGPVLGAVGGPLLLSRTTTDLGPVSTKWFADHSATLNRTGWIFGGDAVVAPSVVTEVTTAAKGGPATGAMGDIAVSPTAAVALTVQSETGSTPTADDRTYTATGLTAGTDYRITLVNAASIRTSTSGAVTFLSSADTASSTGFSVNPGDQTPANITVVNNTTLGTAVATTVTQPVNGSITVTVDGAAAGAVVPVIYLNGATGRTPAQGGNSIRLETAATAAEQFAAPVESFGLGGQITFTSPLAAAGATVAGTAIDSVDKANDSFDIAGARYTYDANDVFRITAGGTTTSVGLAAFEAALSSDDTMTIAAPGFASDPGGVTTFTLGDVNPSTATSATAEKGATTSTSNDLTVSVVIPGAATDYDQVIIQRATVSGSPADESAVNTANIGAYTDVATVTPTAAQRTAGTVTYVDNDVPAGAYIYRAALINDGDTGAYVTDGNVETSVAPSTDTTAPTVIDTRVAANTGSPFQLDVATDSFKLVASEVLAAPGTGDAFRLTDSDGTVADIVNGTGTAAFTLNVAPETVGGVEYPIGRVLTVVVGTVTPGTAGTVTGLGIPSTITATSGNTDVAGNALSLTGDVTVDTES